MSAPTRSYTGGGGLVPSRDTQEANTDAVKLAPGSYAQGTALGQYTGVAAVNEVQTVTVSGTPSGGGFRLAFNGQVTGTIAYNATPAAVQAALEALSNIGTGNVVCAGGDFPGTAITVTFAGTMVALDQPPLTLFSNGLTGGTTPTVSVAETTPGRAAGSYYGTYDDAATDGRQVCRAFLKYATVVDEKGNHDYAAAGPSPSVQKTTVAYFSGTFFTAVPGGGTLALPGLDANGVADVGRMIVGVAGSLTAKNAELKMT